MATSNLKTIRAQIEKLTVERGAVQNALEPGDVLEAKLRAHLAELAAPQNDFLDNCAAILNGTGGTGYTTPATPPMLARAAFAMSLSPERIESIVDAAKSRAAALDGGQMRLTAIEKSKRLDDLDRKIYTSGLDEQTVIGAENQRPDVNAACLLNVPIEAAIQFNVLRG